MLPLLMIKKAHSKALQGLFCVFVNSFVTKINVLGSDIKTRLRPKSASAKIGSSTQQTSSLFRLDTSSVAFGDNPTLTKGQLEACHQIQNCIFAAYSTKPPGIPETEAPARSQFTAIIGCLAE